MCLHTFIIVGSSANVFIVWNAPISTQSAFVADTNLFTDAHLVFGAEIGYKELRIYTPECDGFCSHETITFWGKIMP